MSVIVAEGAVRPKITQLRSRELPRVELLPPVFAMAERNRRTKVLLAAAVAVAVLGTGGVYAQQRGVTDKARAEVQAAQLQKNVLQAKQQKYAAVPQVYAAVDAANSDVVLAMSQEVRWSMVLTDLASRVPSNVWLNEVSATQAGVASASGGGDAAASASVASTATLGADDIGSITITGHALTQAAVAEWLDSLAAQEGFSAPSFSSSVQDDPGGKPYITFTSTVNVTSAELSHRYDSAGQ